MACFRPYKTPQSWGDTYGEHKLYLEFSEEQYRELKRCADENNVLFSASGWDYKAVDFLVELGAPFIKVASVDAGNLKFIEYLAQKNVPLVISSGWCQDYLKRQLFVRKNRHIYQLCTEFNFDGKYLALLSKMWIFFEQRRHFQR